MSWNLQQYYRINLYNVFVNNIDRFLRQWTGLPIFPQIAEELMNQFIVPKTDLYSTAINSNESAQNGFGWSIDHQACIRMSQTSMVMHLTWNEGVGQPVGLGNITPPNTLTTTLDALDAELYPNISFILTVLLTIPVTTATAERFFTSMKRIKTFLGASMADTRLISLAFIHIHRDFRIDINFVIDSFNAKEKQENETEQ